MSAVIPLDAAIDGVIQADATLAAKLQGEKVYSLVAPARDNALPYVVLGQSSEIRRRTFDSKFQDGIVTIDVWSADVTKVEVGGIVADLERLLDGTRLTVAGHHFVTGELSLVAIMVDPSGKYGHASLRYEALNYV